MGEHSDTVPETGPTLRSYEHESAPSDSGVYALIRRRSLTDVLVAVAEDEIETVPPQALTGT